MEPKFKAAGYRDTDNSIRGGNILILTEIGAGDFVSTSGAIREIRRLYPYARITLVVYPRNFELAENCPYVDEIIINSPKQSNYKLFEFYKMNAPIAQRLLEQRFDICFAFTIHPNNPLLMYMSGAKIRVTAIYHENVEEVCDPNRLISHVMQFATHVFPCSVYGNHHANDAFALIENFLHLPIVNRKLEIWYTPADVGIAKQCLQGISSPIYSLNMGSTTGQRKCYPPEKYAKLLEMILHEEPTATFVILGGGQDDLNSAAIIKNVAPQIYENHIIDLTDKINFRQSAAVLSFCDMHIGNDTGTVHVAAAVSCPVLQPNCFAANLPSRPTDILKCWYPYDVPSVIVLPEHALDECNNGVYDSYGCKSNVPHCITQIEPELLFDGFKLLKKRVVEGIIEPIYIY